MAENKNRPGMVLYFDSFAALRKYLTLEELGAAICQFMDYAEYGVEPEDLPPVASVAFDLIRPRIDKDAEAYEDRVRGSQYGVFVKKCKAAGITDYPSIEEWDGTLTIGQPMDNHSTTIGQPMDNPPQPTKTITKTKTKNKLNLTKTKNKLNENENEKGGSRRNSSPSEKSLAWKDADDVLREEVAVLTHDIYAEYVPGRLPEKADALRMFERVCSVDDDGRLYVDPDKEQLMRSAFAYAQNEGTPGNTVAIYRYLRDQGVSA